MKTFDDCLKFVLKWEGGYTNDPADSGGATNLGIIQTEYDRFRKEKGLAKRSVREITMDEARTIYDTKYWQASHAKWLAAPLNLVVFDTAVNMGVGRACQFLSTALGLEPSLTWTQAMSDKVHTADHLKTALAMAAQRPFYRIKRILEKPSQKVFLAGWTNRDRELFDLVLKYEL
ncbi:MAG: hypothetical protein JSS66_06925 [Armatimonadetes bacterium]|nr:hypothetical protein [Armatimonadota bacterium]